MVNTFYSHIKTSTIILIFFVILACLSCTKSMESQADTVFINGHIVTMDESFPEAEAFAVKDGLFLEVGNSEDIPKFAPLGIVISMQPPHATSDMPWAETRIGPQRIKGAYAWRSFLDTGVHLTLNSDFPGESLNPFFGMYAAETRQTPAGATPAGGWYPEQRLTRAEVLNAYTVEAAFSGFEETIKGKIVKGMLADFIVVSDDILTISSKDLLELRVEQTYVSGRLKYENK